MEQKNICDTQSCCRDVESGNKTSLIGKNLVYCKDFYCLNCGFCFTVSKSTTGCTPKKVYISPGRILAFREFNVMQNWQLE